MNVDQKRRKEDVQESSRVNAVAKMENVELQRVFAKGLIVTQNTVLVDWVMNVESNTTINNVQGSTRESVVAEMEIVVLGMTFAFRKIVGQVENAAGVKVADIVGLSRLIVTNVSAALGVASLIMEIGLATNID
jgi:hypothetical protein